MFAAFLVCAALLSFFWLASSSSISRRTGIELEIVRENTTWPFTAFAFLPILFLPFVDYQSQRVTFLSESSLLSMHCQVGIVAVLSAGLVFSLTASRFKELRGGLIDKAVHHPAITISFIVVAWVVTGTIMEVLRNHFLNNPGNNLPVFFDVLNNVFSENGVLYSHLLQVDGSSLLGVHGNFIWFLVSPIFRIWPSYTWLITISNIGLALASVPLYLLSRQFFSRGISILFVLIYLFNRTIMSQPGSGDISEERFLPVLLFSTVYFWQRKKFWSFACFAFLSLLVREDVGIVIAILGLISLIKKRDIKWWAVPLIGGVTWFSFMILWMVPHFNPSGTAAKMHVLYPNLGSTGKEILFTLAFKPWVVIKTIFFNKHHLAAIYGLWQSFGFGAPLLSIFLLLPAPYVGENLLSATSMSLSHFNAIGICATLMPAFIYGLVNLERFSKNRWNRSIVVTLLLCTLFATAALTYSWFSPNLYLPRYNYDEAVSIVDMLPDDATIILPEFMTSVARPAQTIRAYQQLAYAIPDEDGKIYIKESYVIIDTSVPDSFRGSQYFDGLSFIRGTVYSSPDFTRIYEGGNLQLYKKVTDSGE
ncbi:MAG: DUF2079 domain-containing protein [Thermoleophilia bacterium]